MLLASSAENAGIDGKVTVKLATNNAKQVTDARRILTTFLLLPSVLRFSMFSTLPRQGKGGLTLSRIRSSFFGQSSVGEIKPHGN